MRSNYAQTIVAAGMLMLAAYSATAATRLPFRSSFETGNFSEWDGGLEATMTVTSTQASAGTRSAQSVMIAGQVTDNYKDFIFGDHARVGGTPVLTSEGLWLTFDSKFDPGFRFATGANVHKVMILNFEDENSRRRYQLIINVGTSNSEYFIEHLKWNADRSFNRAMPGITQNVGTPALVRYGQWDRFKLFVKPNTSGSANGVVRMWVNDRLTTEYTNIPIRENTNYNPNKIIMANYVNTTTAVGIQRWDNFYLGVTEPTSEVRPNPPVLHEVQ